MKLLNSEIRDIQKLLEAGKPLPEKYRFLLFGDKKEVELVWNGKTSEVANVVLPFQTIEIVDEPRAEKSEEKSQQKTFFNFDERGRQITGWTNKLIWGDNKLILSSLKNGSMREEIEKAGGLKLIYIDPPFDVGADFSMKVEIGDEKLTKKPNVLEELAYRDTWEKGADSFIAMIYERLSLMKDLLAEDGSIYVHCDWRVNSYIRLAMDEIFGNKNFQREIIWDIRVLSGYKTIANNWIRGHETILFYSKNVKILFNKLFQPHTKEYLSGFKKEDEKGKYMIAHKIKRYLKDVEAKGKPFGDVWDDIKSFQQQPTSAERVNYPTQKPETLLERIIKSFLQ